MCAWRVLLLAALPALVGVGAGEVLEVSGAEGPSFLPSRRSVVAPPGGEAVLACRIQNLGDTAVSWVRARDLHILAHAGLVFSADPRVAADVAAGPATVTHTLRLRRLRPADAGRYECQLNTEPKLSQIYNLTVKEDAWRGVEVVALGARTVRAAAGGAATLGCAATVVPAGAGAGAGAEAAPRLRLVWYRNGEPLLPQGGRLLGGVSLEAERGAGGVTSRLTLGALAPADAGRYVCRLAPPEPHPGEGEGEEQRGDDEENSPQGEVVLTLIVTEDADLGEMEAMQRDQSPGAGSGAAAATLAAALALLPGAALAR